MPAARGQRSKTPSPQRRPRITYGSRSKDGRCARETRKGGDEHRGRKQNLLLAFDNLVPRCDVIYAARAAEVPESFEERIHFWHRECALPTDLKGRLHSLRIWANAVRHHDGERWRRDGPCDEAAARLVAATTMAIEALER